MNEMVMSYKDGKLKCLLTETLIRNLNLKHKGKDIYISCKPIRNKLFLYYNGKQIGYIKVTLIRKIEKVVIYSKCKSYFIIGCEDYINNRFIGIQLKLES